MTLSCHLYDTLEIAAMKRQKVRFEFHSPDGKESVFEGLIRDIQTREGKEYAVSETGEHILLDHVNHIEVI